MSKKPNGAVIRSLREEHGFTQAELAIDAGISRAHLASLETERRQATSPTMRRLARALGLRSPDSLIKDDGEAEA